MNTPGPKLVKLFLAKSSSSKMCNPKNIPSNIIFNLFEWINNAFNVGRSWNTSLCKSRSWFSWSNKVSIPRNRCFGSCFILFSLRFIRSCLDFWATQVAILLSCYFSNPIDKGSVCHWKHPYLNYLIGMKKLKVQIHSSSEITFVIFIYSYVMSNTKERWDSRTDSYPMKLSDSNQDLEYLGSATLLIMFWKSC